MSKGAQTDAHHEELIAGFRDQLKTILESSGQSVYLYLDDTHKVCNQRFASLLGYRPPEEWARIPVFTDIVADDSAHALITAYREATDKKIGSTIDVTWITKSGGTADTTVILVPVSYKEHLFALHFVSRRA
jgi:PAS domain-containing protein